MLKKDKKEKFIEKVKKDSEYTCFLSESDLIKLLNRYDKKIEKVEYKYVIKKPLDLAMEFYKNYNIAYYELILQGLENKQIIVSEDVKETRTGKIFKIKLGKVGDEVFKIVHEFAHYIDLNMKPLLTPFEMPFLCETFSYYMEKQLEIYLLSYGYTELVKTRRQNRETNCTKMVNAIKYMRQVIQENLEGKEISLDESQIDFILLYNPKSTINYFIRYPLGDLCSDYLIINNIEFGNETINILLNTKFENIRSLKRIKM